MNNDLDADRLIDMLGLQPHPEGGRFVETYRAPAEAGCRSAVTAIYFLLRAGERSHWHTVDAVEIWHWYGGAPLELSIYDESDTNQTAKVQLVRLGLDLAAGERPQAVVPPHAWQAARSLGAWTLVGCTVSPGFEFSGFTLARPGWQPV